MSEAKETMDKREPIVVPPIDNLFYDTNPPEVISDELRPVLEDLGLIDVCHKLAKDGWAVIEDAASPEFNERLRNAIIDSVDGLDTVAASPAKAAGKNMNLREDKSWSYGARAGISYSKGQRLMVVRAPVQTDKTAESIQEILQEYNTYLSSKPIEDSELDKIKRARTLRLPGQYETLGALMSGIEDIVSNERDFNYLNTLSDKRNAILLKDVRVAAKKYIDPNSWTWVIVGDLLKTLKPCKIASQ